MRTYARLFPAIAALVLTACPTEPEGRAKEPRLEEDDWSRIPPSKEWLFATSDFSGAHKAECDFVLTAIKAEGTCKASICEYARDLASEWMTRCQPLVTAGVLESVRALRSDYDNRAKDSADRLRQPFFGDATRGLRGCRWVSRRRPTMGDTLRQERRHAPDAQHVEADGRASA